MKEIASTDQPFRPIFRWSCIQTASCFHCVLWLIHLGVDVCIYIDISLISMALTFMTVILGNIHMTFTYHVCISWIYTHTRRHWHISGSDTGRHGDIYHVMIWKSNDPSLGRGMKYFDFLSDLSATIYFSLRFVFKVSPRDYSIFHESHLLLLCLGVPDSWRVLITQIPQRSWKTCWVIMGWIPPLFQALCRKDGLFPPLRCQLPH